jgi:hypothetical protein
MGNSFFSTKIIVKILVILTTVKTMLKNTLIKMDGSKTNKKWHFGQTK